MRLLEYTGIDISQHTTIPRVPVIHAPPRAKKIRMSRSRRQFWLHFALVCFFLFMEICALVAWGIVTNDAVLPPFKAEKTPVAVPCAHIKIYFDPTQTTQQSYVDESCP
jgi:hypothetical protein